MARECADDPPPAGLKHLRPSPWELAAAVLIAGFLFGEVLLIVVAANGPTLDESIYLMSGRRTLEGHGLTDGYLGWFAGSQQQRRRILGPHARPP